MQTIVIAIKTQAITNKGETYDRLILCLEFFHWIMSVDAWIYEVYITAVI